MKLKILLITAAIIAGIFIASTVFAGGPGSGGMGGGGHGMMGGGHMMDYGRGNPIPYLDQYNRYNRPEESYLYGPRETKTLREEIREKRQELSELYRAENPDKALIDKKINELDKLEAELDYRLSGTENQRR
jgi:Spy/CpxP family protein refolding chaperone